MGKDYFIFMPKKTVLRLFIWNHDGYFCFRNGLGQPSKIRIFRSVLHQSSSNKSIVIDDIKYQNCCECKNIYISKYYGLEFSYRNFYCKFPVYRSNDILNFTCSSLTSFIIYFLQNYLQVPMEDIILNKNDCVTYSILQTYQFYILKRFSLI